jgi:hypothetical protein
LRQIAYLNFDLAVDGGDGTYAAQVRASPVGESRTPVAVALPPSLGVERFASGAVPTLARPDLEAFGEGLFNAVFGSEVRLLLARSFDRCKDRGVGLRIRLRVCDDLATLPWEYLWDPEEGDFLALSHRSPIVRYTELAQSVEPLQVEPPLRILVVISDPKDLPRLDVEREWGKLTDALSGLSGRGKVVIDRLEESSMDALQRALRRGEYHVFHFVGHGGFDPVTNEGVVAFEDGTGLRKLVSAQLLGTWLNDSPSLRLAVLNACEGARTAAQNPFAGVAQRLLRRGIPAIIAMQFEISDGAALAFSRAFYEAVADGYPIDASVAEARKTILEMSAVEWGTPVLYMRSEDGRVFDLGAAAPGDVDEGAAEEPEPSAPGEPMGALLDRARERWATAVAEPDEASRTRRLQESHDLLLEARKAEPGNTEVLTMMAQVLVDLTPDDPTDERRLLLAIRRLLEEPKDEAERFRLGTTLLMLASTHATPGSPPSTEFDDALREARGIFEGLGRADMIERCDALQARADGGAGDQPADDAATAPIDPFAMTASLPAPPPAAADPMTPPVAGSTEPIRGPVNLVGRWRVQDAVGSVVILDLYPNGMYQGVGRIVPMQFAGDLHLGGQWGFEPMSGLLQLQGVVNGMLPFAYAGFIQGRQGAGYVGVDNQGQPFTLTPA